MAGFSCKKCNNDLTPLIDIFIRSMQAKHSEDDSYPEELMVGGRCDECSFSYEFSGPMFTSFIVAKAKEDIVGEDAREHEMYTFELTEEEFEEYNDIQENGTQDELIEFLRKIYYRDEE
jgi:hypothetical protein